MIGKIQGNTIAESMSTKLLIVIIIVAFLMNLIPLTGWAQRVRPDILLLVILYWGINSPQKVNFFVIFALGILSDVANGSIIGQTSLLYLVFVFIAVATHRRVRLFKPIGQMLYVFPALFLVKLGTLTVLFLVGVKFPGWSYFYPVASTVLFWPLLNSIINLAVSSFNRS